MMPSVKGDPGEFSSNLEFFNWLFRKFADEAAISDKDATFNGAVKGGGVDETAFYTRVKTLRALCVDISTQPASSWRALCNASPGRCPRRCGTTSTQRHTSGDLGAT